MNPRLRRFCLNAGGMLLGKGLGTACSLLAVPLVVTQLGVNGFGMWAVCQTLVVWIQSLDLGLGLGLQNQISHAVTPDERANAARSAGALQATMLAAATLFIVAALTAIWWWPGLLLVFGPDLAASDAALGRALLVITALTMAASLLAQTVLRTAAGMELLGQLSGVQSAGSLIGLVVLAAGPALALSPLVGIAVIALLPVLAQLGVGLLLLQHPQRQWARPVPGWNGSDWRRLFTIGGWFFLSQIASLVIFQTNVVIVSGQLGVVEAGSFQVTASIFALLVLGQGVVLNALWPAIANAWAAKDRAWIANTYRWAAGASVALIGLTVALAMAAPWLVETWTSETTLRPQPVLAWGLATTCATTLWANLHATCLNAIGAVRQSAVLALIQAAINLAAVLLAIRWWGAVGVAWASAICAAVSSVPFLWLYWRRSQDHHA